MRSHDAASGAADADRAARVCRADAGGRAGQAALPWVPRARATGGPPVRGCPWGGVAAEVDPAGMGVAAARRCRARTSARSDQGGGRVIQPPAEPPRYAAVRPDGKAWNRPFTSEAAAGRVIVGGTNGKREQRQRRADLERAGWHVRPLQSPHIHSQPDSETSTGLSRDLWINK
jgi:hypothetical protein